MPLVHAENGDVVFRLQAALHGSGITGPEGHAYSRPPEVEGEATNRAIMIADMAGSPALYRPHLLPRRRTRRSRAPARPASASSASR